jgi:hypothetical protein
MKYLPLIAFLMFMQASPPIPRKATDTRTGSSKDIQTNADQHKTPSPAFPIQGDPQAPSKKQNGADVSTHDEPKPVRVTELPPVSVARDSTDCLSLFFTGLLVLAAIVGVVSAIKTLRAIEKQAVLMKDQLVEMQQAREMSVVKERARIHIEPPDAIDLNTYKLGYTVTNSGTTPAIIYFSHVTAEISFTGNQPKPERGDQMPLPENFSPGTFALHTMIVGDPALFHEVLDEQIECGEVTVRFWGYINYRDLFFKGDGFWRKNFHYVWDRREGRFMRHGEAWENTESKKEEKKAN